jgi:hypothetical protein
LPPNCAPRRFRSKLATIRSKLATIRELIEVGAFRAPVRERESHRNSEGARSKTGIAAALTQLPTNPVVGLRELRAQFSNDKMKVLVREQIESDLLKLALGTHSFIRQLGDFLQTEVLQHDDCFQFLRHLLNSAVRRLNRKNSRRMPTCWHFAKWLASRSRIWIEF